MKLVEIGKLDGQKPFKVDVGRIVEGKMVVQASSGGGKSMTLRTLLEATHGLLPHIILDKDGEYATLRERHDYVLAGKGGDIPTDVRNATMLARKVMELDLSIIVDLYDLNHADKHRFVRLFMEAAFNAPKGQWHDRLFVVDEAHRFCPENGEGTSEAKDIIIECCDDGRKRGMGMILATQRIAKLDKSALAECENKLIGRTNYDDDRRRAGKELGFSSKEDLLSIRDLKRGQFYAQGAALSYDVVKTTINVARTTHPSSGHRIIKKAPAPTAKVRAALAKLSDIPKEVEKETNDLIGLKSQVHQLQTQLRQAKQVVATAPTFKTDVKIVQDAHERGRQLGYVAGAEAQRKTDVEAFMRFKSRVRGQLTNVDNALGEEPVKLFPAVLAYPKAKTIKDLMYDGAVATRKQIMAVDLKPKPVQGAHGSGADPDVKLGLCERSILAFLNLHPGKFYRVKTVTTMIGYRPGGAMNTAVGRLVAASYVKRQAGTVALNAGTSVSHLLAGLPHTMDQWIEGMGKRERMIFELVQTDKSRVWSVQEVMENIGAQPGGALNTAVARLVGAELVTRVKDPRGLMSNTEIDR